ncbi:DNA mismatch repair protein Msh2-like [Nilaparvata lugens]|uniref:DNA mismatch repair protein Msh2-like n=1 Tax=Nilaparvata lugens TaxID=108931 RepID=UPI00193E5296|nr:DNA mismatch repair protein Msh2-like [Nilaparvata lugens]
MLFANSDQVESPAVLAVRLTTNAKNKIIGLASVDIPAHTMSLCEFPDDEHFSNLEAMVVQIGPKEVLIPAETSLEADKIKMIMERSGALVTVCKKSDFSTDNLVQDMNKLILFKEGQQQNANALPQMNLATATGALAALVKYLEVIHS